MKEREKKNKEIKCKRSKGRRRENSKNKKEIFRSIGTFAFP